MAVAAAEQQIFQPQNVNHELERINDEATWLAEALYGSMRSEFEFEYDGEDLVAVDGRRLGPIFDTAITDAKEMVQSSPNLLFELRRRIVEHEEYAEMLAMAQGHGPNIMIVVSDFPEELMSSSEDVGGYNAKRKQAMVRVITRDNDGVIKIRSQSLDKSDRQSLEKIYASFGVVPEDGELLGQRISLDLPEQWQAPLVDSIRDTYDQELTEQFDGTWFAGIAIGDVYRKQSTYDFVVQQRDVLEWLTENIQAQPAKASQFRYNAAALIEKRYTSENDIKKVILSSEYIALNIDAMARQAGNAAKQEGKTYSGCGMSLASGEIAENQIDDAGYGNKTEADESYSFNKVMHCVVCQSPPKKGEGKKNCGPCGICKSCDKKLGGKG